ncbi:hypothetical protein EJ419_05215 [Alloscardovia theropitheci]|uniref:Uncharacterized protein n=1 Tax=Alloscardovia theropitheci TaxID=2496842 RepID=A0A4R0QXC2_9BIFI|nr:hypothetical protein [Alloscardovia theropitheci]TCD54061.1 hypothetical protein EJ419_05215 [Alloscardovia theropitheci]
MTDNIPMNDAQQTPYTPQSTAPASTPSEGTAQVPPQTSAPQPLSPQDWHNQFVALNGRAPSAEEYNAAVSRGEIRDYAQSASAANPLPFDTNQMNETMNTAVNNAKLFADEALSDVKNFKNLSSQNRQDVLILGSALGAIIALISIFLPLVTFHSFAGSQSLSVLDILFNSSTSRFSDTTIMVVLSIVVIILTAVLKVQKKTNLRNPIMGLSLVAGLVAIEMIIGVSRNFSTDGSDFVQSSLNIGYYLLLIGAIVMVATSVAAIVFWLKDRNATTVPTIAPNPNVPVTPNAPAAPSAPLGQTPVNPAEAQNPSNASAPMPAPMQAPVSQTTQFTNSQPTQSVMNTPVSQPAGPTQAQWLEAFQHNNGRVPTQEEFNAALARGEFVL